MSTQIGFKIGYARVSTDEQSLDVQIEELKRAGCVKVFSEHASGALPADKRPQLSIALDLIGEGVTLVVPKLDRLARNTQEMLAIAERVGRAGGGLQSIAEPWADTNSPAGTLVLTIMAGVAQFERDRIAERRTAGIAKAKAAGKYKGRKPSIDGHQVEKLLGLGMGPAEVARTVKCSESRVYQIRDAAREAGRLPYGEAA